MSDEVKFKAICFDWGNTIEVGTPKIVTTLQQIWERFVPDVQPEQVLGAAQVAWKQLITLKPTRKDLKDMSHFRQMLWARQAEIMAHELGVDIDIPDWPWEANDDFNVHYYKRRARRIPEGHKKLLKKLREADVPMVIVANDSDSEELQKVISKVGLTGYFETGIASSTFGFAKPHSKIYLAALNRLDLRADEVLFVGDDFYNDYWGPSQVGMFPVLFDPNGLYARTENIRRIKKLDEVLQFLDI